MRPAVAAHRLNRRRPTARVGIAAALSVVLTATLIHATSSMAPAAEAWKPPVPRDVTGVAVAPAKHAVRQAWTAGSREAHPTAVAWPAPGSVTVDLTDSTARTAGGDHPAGALPIRVRASTTPGAASREAAGHDAVPVSRVTVEVADRTTAQRAGVSGLVASIGRADGRREIGAVDVTFDYSAFAHAYGGDWASRLHVIRLSDGKPLKARNNAQAQTVYTSVPLTATGVTTIALAAAPAGDNGNYTATSLKPASTWQVSPQTGAFSWSYPLTNAPAMGGPEPDLGLSYSSGAVDGLSGGTNNQGSWIGDGWDMWPGFIERQYKPCADDKKDIRGGAANNSSVYGGDLCWYKPDGNATISFNGQATELVKSSGNTWKATADDGSKIELVTDAGLGICDNDGGYWKLTKPDGTQYFFGCKHGQGGSSAATATNSTWTVPVYGNHPDEPGYNKAGFAASRTTQAWRWNLDLLIDPRGNTMTYFYDKETGAYGREGDKDKRTTYDRGGYLTRIEYGSRTDAPTTALPAAQILFDTADRCASNCWSGNNPVTASWLDTPWDQYCSAAPCAEQLSPTFWTAKRLSRIRAQVYSGSGTTYQDVTWWTLRHTYLQSGASEGQPMWLAGITRTGKVTTAGGTESTDPEIVFAPGAEALANRVDAMADGRSNLFRYRITTVTTESGAQIVVTYSPPECRRTALPTAHANSKRCYPQYYAPDGEEPTLDWFHHYRVSRIDTYDNAGGFDHEQTNYDYLDTPAWHYDDSELVDEDKRTWGQFRGYSKVRVRTGLESGVQSATEYLFFRGMDGDKQPTGTRDEWITDSQGVKVKDHEAYAGLTREETTLLGAGGTWISGTITTPALQGPTATSGRLKAWMTYTSSLRKRTKLSNGTTRWTKTVTTVNSDNLPTQVDDLGDESTADDDVCVRTWYARNATTWMLNQSKKTETVGVSCSTTATLPGDMISSTRTTYDAETNNWDTDLPVQGNVAKVEEIDSWTGSTPNWVATSRSKYDTIGRVTESTDALDQTSTTAYIPASGGPVTSIVTTNPLRQATTTTYATAWQQPTSVLDPNNIRTDLAYDGLGRLIKAWLPGRPKSTYPNGPSTEYSYQVRNTAPTAVTTKTLMPYGNSTYHTSITLFDGLLRARQVQTQAPRGGRTLTDTVYDSRGLLDWSAGPYYDKSNAAPETTLYDGSGTPAIPALTQNIYDGAGRLTDAIFKVGVNESTNEKWRTTTVYNGEKTSTIPPAGGTATTIITDARQKTTTLRQYKDRTNAGSDDPATFDASRYSYTDRGELASHTDPAGNTWRYTYDQRGRKIREDDPDRGVTTSTYDKLSQLLTTTDAEQKTLAYTYDALGRKTSIRDNSTVGPLRAEWTYDTVRYGIGKPAASKRYEPAGSTNAYINEVAEYDTYGRPLTTTVTIPATEGSLCAAGTLTPCTYSYAATYRANGDLATAEAPAAAGLAKEKLNYVYSEVGLLNGVQSASQSYLTDALYNKLGQLNQQILGSFGKRTWITSTIDENTGRTTNTNGTPEGKPELFNFGYDYDDAGNITEINDAPDGGSTDTQCYDYDYLRRLTNAWTPATGDCAPGQRSVANLGGPAPYWHSYSYHPGTDNRHQETFHASTSTIRTYTYPDQGGATGTHPHAVSTINTTGPASKSETFTYDMTGNTLTRPGPTGAQTLAWNSEGKLATSTDSSGATSYIYDADGNRLIRRDPNGAASLYLPGGTEVRKSPTGAAAGTRYYPGVNGFIAVRTSAGSLDWIVSDHHGTAEATISNGDLSATRRRSLPFGGQRGATPNTWPIALDKGFVGGTQDPTGLTHLGAREYDPAIGKFISADPLIDPADFQQWNGYAYANNAPVTASDPDGLMIINDGRGQYVPPAVTAAPSKPAKKSFWGSIGSGFLSGAKRAVVDPVRDTAKRIGDGWTSVYNNANAVKDGKMSVQDAFIDAGKTFVSNYVSSIVGVPLGIVGIYKGWAATIEHAADGDYEAAAASWTESGIGAISVAAGARTGFKAGAKGCVHSFAPTTPVLLADGTHRAIGEIAAGDLVLATDPETGDTTKEPVIDLHANQDTDLTDLTLKAGDGGLDTLHTTQHHPFWSDSREDWIDAAQLQRDERLRTADSRIVTVEKVRNFTGNQGMRDLTVADVHTYYVIAADAPVLVHNCGSTPPGVSCSCFPATGAGPSVSPIRVEGPWTRGDIGRGSHGLRPNHLGDRIEIHHADQMPGSPIHEVDQVTHRGTGSLLHPNAVNQGVTPTMRAEDTKLHWWYRSQEQGWGHYDPEIWFENWSD
ncbi:polymorphic toxin-type HINT domain-containing protein [Micromonospora sp. CA-249363]|uniref:polymorphic toxin-type HINT domain-containing protein n=1 Tax=Micromonospora sp. CA-249363 TaxID=3239963 RepID=UPI003D934A68